jgi:anti-anti-sigma factor
MDYTTRTIGEGLEVAMTGRFTYADHQKFRDLIATFPSLRGKRLVLEMSQVEFVDSAAMGMLLLARETAVGAGVDTVICNPTGKVRSLMQVAHFDKLFAID